jgi:PKD repeat protein
MILQTRTKQMWFVSLFLIVVVAFACGDEKDLDEVVDGGDAGGGTHSDGGGSDDLDGGSDGDTDVDTTIGEATVAAAPEDGPAPLQTVLSCEVEGGSPPFSFSWDFGDGLNSDIQNPSHTYVSIGTYTATCTVTDHAGKVYQGNVDVAVNDPDISQGPVIDEIRVNSGQAAGIPSNCAVVNQDQVQLMVLAHDQSVSSGPPVIPDGGVDGGGALELDPLIYQWVFESKPAGSVAVLNNAHGFNPTFTPDRHGTYVIRVFVSDDQAGTITLTTGTAIVMAGVVDRIVSLGPLTRADGLAGETDPVILSGHTQNHCGARGPVGIAFQGVHAKSPTPQIVSSKEKDTLGFFQIFGIQNGCPPLPGSASLTGTPVYNTLPDWYPPMLPTTWTWTVVVSSPAQLRATLERQVPVLEGAEGTTQGLMDFGVSWADNCGNKVTGTQTIHFRATIYDGSGCTFWLAGADTGLDYWDGSTTATEFPKVGCMQAGRVRVRLSNLTGGSTWGGECNITDTSFDDYYGTVFGTQSFWHLDGGYYAVLGPYYGYYSWWFDGSSVPAFGWDEYYYAALEFYGDSSYYNCDLFSQYPYPYRLEWYQANNFETGGGGFMMGYYGYGYVSGSHFDLTGGDSNIWWNGGGSPAYDGTIDGRDAWIAASGWGLATADVTGPMAQWVCNDYDWTLYWMLFVGQGTALVDSYWMIDSYELWGWCDDSVDSEFIAGPYRYAEFETWYESGYGHDDYIYGSQDGVIDCPQQPGYVHVVGYDENNNPTPGAQVVITFAGPGTTSVVVVHRGTLVDPAAGTATITLGPKGDAIVFLTSDTAGIVPLTVTAIPGFTDDTIDMELFTLATNENTDPTCSNNVDDDCDGLTDCDDVDCAATTPCLPDLVFMNTGSDTYFSYRGGDDELDFSYRVTNNFGTAGPSDCAVYITATGAAVPSGTIRWSHSVTEGMLHPAINQWDDYPDGFNYTDYIDTSALIPGDYLAWLWVDNALAVAESDDTNNYYSAPFHVAGPNLTAGWTAHSAGDADLSSGSTFSLNFENDGDANLVLPLPADCFSVSVFAIATGGDPDVDTPYGTVTETICGTDTFDSGQFNDQHQHTGTFDASSIGAITPGTDNDDGDYDLYMRLDSLSEIDELDETPGDNLVGPVTFTFTDSAP